MDTEAAALADGDGAADKGGKGETATDKGQGAKRAS